MKRQVRWCAGFIGALVLGGCGGGAGGGGGVLPIPALAATSGATAKDEIVASSTVAGRCAAPRQGIDPDTGATYPDVPGTTSDEKRWLRGWTDETYLWYEEVPRNLVAANYATPIDYFAVLKTSATAPSGRPKDRFHFTYDTAAYRQVASTGVATASYGMELAFLSAAPPRDVRVASAEPGTPAGSAGIGRGAKVLEIDGVDVVNGSDVAALNAGLAPVAAGERHLFKLARPDGSTVVASLVAAGVRSSPTVSARTIDVGGHPVGYLLFNDHNEAAEAQLIAAIRQFKDNGIGDLVIDLRYNGGGLLSIASQLAYMVATPAATQDTTFELLQFNGKNPFQLSEDQTRVPFYGSTRGYSTTPGQPLPQLGLSRVTMLTGPDTCSASESIINSLRGVGVSVNLVGGATCGKPYGYFPQDNCGTTYFTIQFKGVNQQGFGDYSDGFAPNCVVADDLTHDLGDPAEGRLAAALMMLRGGACPTAAKTAIQLEKAASGATPTLWRTPIRENRLIDTLKR
ncbi:S41 family peptidase [Variovorax sp. dw_308]|uniref:S41 family peptidase n=1 Tax=Variovorax sp. dw_308 TaxID=2721546 RepID=UPI00210F1E1C|nr:S41 family peptidase [Variovorax sp. dw_308]